MARAFEAFVYGAKTYTEIARELGYHELTVAGWGRHGKWLEKRRAVLQDLEQAVHVRCRRIILAHKPQVMARHIRVAERLESSVEAIAEKLPLTPKSTKTLGILSRSLRDASDVSARAVGLTSASAATAPVNLIQINVGSLPSKPAQSARPAESVDAIVDVDANASPMTPNPPSASHGEPSAEPERNAELEVVADPAQLTAEQDGEGEVL
jgi:hypothetical protein